MINNTSRKIIHIDMDAFYASVEQRDNINYQNKPLIVGGNTNRGVVSTCSYEARKFGVHSAMSIYKARQLLPNGIYVKHDIEKYKKVSQEIRKIFYKYSDKVEPLSLDEAYIDVTTNKLNIKSATEIALLIQEDIKKTLNLTCSCGISYNKFLAKTASDINKPYGHYIITPKYAEKFLEELPIHKFYGIGKVTTQKMISLGIYTGKDLKALSKEFLIQRFQNRGLFYYNIVRGIDNREVVPNRVIKSISNERTLETNISDISLLKDEFNKVFNLAYTRLEKSEFSTKTLTIKVKFDDFSIKTISTSFDSYTINRNFLYKELFNLLNKINFVKAVRLVGVGFSNFSSVNSIKKFEQLKLNI